MAEATLETDPLGLLGETVAERFVVEQLVAEGGFGVVYRARHIGLDRPVALKVLKPTASSTFLQQTFEAEARIIARLEHPNIVAVHDFGVSLRDSGVPLHWIALEWLEGHTLAGLLRERRAQNAPPMDPASALELMTPILECMAFAHERGVVHRDLKPSNIFLQAQAGRWAPKVLDFGIARMVAPDAAPPNPAASTRGFRAFSPDYAAPEQVTHARTGPFTDVHALALIVTELLTGQAPYGPDSPCAELAGPFEAVLALQRPTPGSKGIGVGTWEAVLARAMARRPSDRQPHAAALLEELQRELPNAGKASSLSPARGSGETRIHLCGHLTVRLLGERSEDRLSGKRLRMLFVYLIVHRRQAVPRGQLIEAVWPEAAPSAPESALSALLARLKAALPGGAISGREQVRLQLPAPWVDIEAAFEALHRAESAVAASDWARAWGPARVALHIARRTFLPGLEAGWINEVRDRLQDVQLRSYECVAAAGLGLGPSELASAERSARSLIRLAPYRESGFRYLMRALIARGNPAEALLTYQQLERNLAERLGIAPGPSTREIYRQIQTPDDPE